MNPSCQAVLGTVRGLHVLPAFADRVRDHLESPRANATQAAREIGRDPGLAAMILRAANAPRYRASREVRDVTEALVLLGFDHVREMLLARLVGSSVRKADDVERALCAHAFAAAVAAETCARAVRGVTVGHAFTAALLHDIGRAILREAYPEDYGHVLQRCRDGWGTVQEVEQARYGTDHLEVGTALVRAWNLAPIHELATSSHDKAPAHATISDRDRRLLAIVRLADHVSARLDSPVLAEAAREEIEPSSELRVLGGAASLLDVMEDAARTQLAVLGPVFG